MRAVVRAIDSPDVDVCGYVSADPENDGVFLQVYAGPADGTGEESFNVMVCTPAWLQDRIQRDGPQIGRHYLIVYPMDLKLAVRFLKRGFEECHADTWVGLGEKLGRLGQWEFEDYAD